jgi:hypothetical protein
MRNTNNVRPETILDRKHQQWLERNHFRAGSLLETTKSYSLASNSPSITQVIYQNLPSINTFIFCHTFVLMINFIALKLKKWPNSVLESVEIFFET